MRARIVKCPDYSDTWTVYTKDWWWPGWKYRKAFSCDGAQERANECAKQYINPRVIEVTK